MQEAKQISGDLFRSEILNQFNFTLGFMKNVLLVSS